MDNEDRQEFNDIIEGLEVSIDEILKEYIDFKQTGFNVDNLAYEFKIFILGFIIMKSGKIIDVLGLE